jgi:DNA-binding winged helix-turn-helix (wHTH) protein
LLNEAEPAPAPGSPPVSRGVRYRFQDVEVDTSRQVLRVAGREVTCQPRVFQLLQLLCEADGGVVGREQIFARLWPGQAIPSDESLTQVVHRLRATLGAASGMVRTVRGVGFRLDSPIERESSGAPAGAAAAPEPAAATAALRHGRGLWSRPAPLGWIALAALAVLAAAAAGWLALARPWQVIDSGYGLVRGDLSPARRQTIDLVERALVAERRGDRAQARHLLEIAHATDATTPVPAAFRCLFSYWQESTGDAEGWARAAAGRLRPSSSPYLHLLVRYAAATASGRGADWLAAASALLAVRPSAWYLQLARAHYHLSQREPAAALVDLRQIPIAGLDSISLALVLADRASLGDAAAAERDLAAGGLRGQEALTWYVRGRMALSARHPAAAVAAFDRELDLAQRRNQPDLIADARLLGGVAACASGDLAGAASRFDLAAAVAGDRHLPDDVASALGLGAYLAWRRGDLAGRDRRLAEAARVHAEPDQAFAVALTLLALWTGAPPPQAPLSLAARLPDVPELTGTRALLLARQAWAAGNLEEARHQLRQARAEGVGKTYFWEEAQLLGADLGEPPAAMQVDPPYPNLLRLAAATELSHRRLALPAAGRSAL